MEKEKKNRTAYLNQHQKNKYKRVVALIRNDDTELIEKLNSVESINGYVYDLIKKDVYGEEHE